MNETERERGGMREKIKNPNIRLPNGLRATITVRWCVKINLHEIYSRLKTFSLTFSSFLKIYSPYTRKAINACLDRPNARISIRTFKSSLT